MRQARQNQPSLPQEWLDLEHAKELQRISAILDEHPRINELILQDLRRASGATEDTGADGMSAEQVLRALVVKQFNGFSYRELAFHLADSRSYQTFCRIGIGDEPPKKSALQGNIKVIRAETLEKINRILVRAAQEEGIEDGTRVRVDSTATETDIHHPTDSELLWDCVRVLVRLMRRGREILGADVVRFCDRTTRAKRRRYEINSAKSFKQRKAPYRDLLKVTAEICGYAREVREVLRQDHRVGLMDGAVLKGLADAIDHYLPLAERVMEQTRRRVLEGQKVPAQDKVLSIFEPHTDLIVKDGADPIYGHKLCLTAGSTSMVLDCKVLEGNPADSSLPVEMIDRQIDIYGRAPEQASYDGAFFSKGNVVVIKDKGVQDVAFAKRRGVSISDMASSVWVYKQLRKFRAGIEGIVSYLKRVFGLTRCTWNSRPSFESYVWSSVVACTTSW